MLEKNEEAAQLWLVNNIMKSLRFWNTIQQEQYKKNQKPNIALWIIREFNYHLSLRTAKQLLMNIERVEIHMSTDIFEGLDNMSLKKKPETAQHWLFWEWNNLKGGTCKLWETGQHKVQRKMIRRQNIGLWKF